MTDNKKKLYLLMANSFVMYILAYLLIHIPTQLLNHIIATVYGIPTRFHYFKLSYPIPDHSYLWTQDSVAALYASGPALAFLVAIFIARHYIYTAEKKGNAFNLFMIWLFAHCVNLIFGGLAIGIPIIKGFGYVPHWLYASSGMTIGLITISLIILFGNGFLLRTPFTTLYFNDRYFNSPYHSLIFKVFVVYLPFLVANVLFFFIKFPDNSLYEHLLWLTMLVQLVGILPYHTIYRPDDYEYKKAIFSQKGLVITLIIICLFWGWKSFHNSIVYEKTETHELFYEKE